MLTPVRKLFDTLQVAPPDDVDLTKDISIALKVKDVTTDSVFVGIAKHKNDSVRFARKALHSGARFAVISGAAILDASESNDSRVYHVTSTAEFLRDLLAEAVSEYIDQIKSCEMRIKKGVSLFHRLQRSNILSKNDDKFSSIIASVDPKTIRHPVLRDLEVRKTPIMQGISFHKTMIELSESRRIGARNVDWALDHKRKAYEFCDKIGVRRPACSDIGPLSKILEILRQNSYYPTVLKPSKSTGSRGVVIMKSPADMLEVKTGTTFTSIDQIHDRYARRIAERAPGFRVNEWYTEEAIYEDPENTVPARDLKFYTFYGEVVLVLEVIRRGGNEKYCLWSPEGTHIVDSGKYEAEGWTGTWKPPLGSGPIDFGLAS